jgi:hypothetical protein
VILTSSFDAVGGRLSHRIAYWQQVCQDRRILQIVREGLRLSPLKEIPLSQFPCQTPIPANQEARRALEEEISVLLEKQAVERTEHPSSGFWSKIFLVPNQEIGGGLS